ncbi:MAG: hypothetical protein ACOVP1_10130 [Bacteroidia bacterium]
MQVNQDESTYRIAAIWAFAESGLGGLMHAFKIPFTGIFIGGMAVLMLILLGHQSKFKVILQTTLLVMLVKLIASPQAPPPAYLAVAFQGLSAAIIYTLIPQKTIATFMFTIIAMMESALQKIIITTLIYGKAFWEAIDLFSESVLKDMGYFSDFQLSWWLIFSYCGIYFIWGIVLGFWGLSIQKRKESTGKALLKFIKDKQIKIENSNSHSFQKKNKVLPYVSILVIIGMLLIFYIMGFKSKELVFILFRSLFALLFLIFVLNPVLKYFLIKWSETQSEKRQQEIDRVLGHLPFVRNNWLIAKEIIKQSETNQLKSFKILETFIFLSLVNHDASEE